MNNEQPDTDQNPPQRQQDKTGQKNRQNHEMQPEKDDQGDEKLDIPLKGLGLPDRDLKKNLGCG